MIKEILIATVGIFSLSSNSLAVDFDVCDFLPPLDKMETPTVPFDVYVVSNENVVIDCGLTGPGERGGCAVPDNLDWKHHTTVHWTIYLNNKFDAMYQHCTLQYEESHLPPNNWYDPQVETHKPW